MSKSEENTNELESYGVWVKNTAQTPEDIADTQEKTEDSLDLPEFDNTDFSDMFKNDSEFEAPETPSAEVDETNLFANGEELSNDSASDEVILHDFPEDNNVPEETEIPEEETFDIPEMDTASEIEEPEINIPEAPATENSTTEDSAFDGISEIETEAPASIDNLEINTETPDTNADFEEISFDSIDEPAAETQEKNTAETPLSPGEEEISLDDFLEDGFSDDSVASGNNGYEPGKGPDAQTEPAPAPAESSGGTEDISLDDFMDASDFGVEMSDSPAQEAPADETPDEPPLEMDISFDDTTDTIETEDNKVTDDFADFTADDTEDFESDTDSTPAEETSDEVYVADTSNVSTEEVDLSDFGIDSDAEETPVTQNVEEKKAEETVVDYDLAIGDEDSLASAPVINEIKTEEQEEKAEGEQPASAPEVQPAQPDPATTSLLQQIVAELSGLKNDINKLKSEIDEVKEREANALHTPVSDAPDFTAEPEPAISEEIPVEQETDNEGGFFSGDEDETIALSADELTNIPIDTDSVIEAESEVPIEETEVPVEETAEEAEVPVEETEVQIEETEVPETPSDDTGFFTDEGDDTIALSGDELTNIMNTSEISESDGVEEAPVDEEITVEETSFEPEVETEQISEEPVIEDTVEPVIENDIVEPVPFEAEETAVSEDEVQEETFEEPVLSDTTEEISFDFEDKNLEEPDIENIQLDDVSDSELPEEISIPKEDDSIFVESTSSDFMNSINSSSEETAEEISPAIEESPVEETTVEETTVEETTVEETTEEEPATVEEPAAEEIPAEQVSFETTDSIFEEGQQETESAEFDSTDTLFEEHFDTTETILSDNKEASEPAINEPAPAPAEEKQEVSNDLENAFSEAASEIFDEVDTSIEPVTEEVIEEPVFEAPAETSVEVPAEEPVETEDNEVPTVDKIISQSNDSANIDSNFAEVDNLDTNISKDNIDYLKSDKEVESETSSSSNEDLKRDIKSVLLYMDQLLENLPEEKIMEFAKSDEFVTYKKLFSDLGLS